MGGEEGVEAIVGRRGEDRGRRGGEFVVKEMEEVAGRRILWLSMTAAWSLHVLVVEPL